MLKRQKQVENGSIERMEPTYVYDLHIRRVCLLFWHQAAQCTAQGRTALASMKNTKKDKLLTTFVTYNLTDSPGTAPIYAYTGSKADLHSHPDRTH